MRHFKTTLLWLAFLLLISQIWIDVPGYPFIGFIFRMIPSICLLIWFILSLFFKQTLLINAQKIPNWALNSLKVLRPLASSIIVLGALFKIMHWPWGNILLVIGIGAMASYSTVLNKYATSQSQQDPEIIDDLKN